MQCYSGNLFKCSVCQYVYYCNRSCQRLSWPIHSKECVSLKKCLPRVVPNVARLMARIIIKLNQGGDEEIGYYNETNYRKFEDLMSRKLLYYIKRTNYYLLLFNSNLLKILSC